MMLLSLVCWLAKRFPSTLLRNVTFKWHLITREDTFLDNPMRIVDFLRLLLRSITMRSKKPDQCVYSVGTVIRVFIPLLLSLIVKIGNCLAQTRAVFRPLSVSPWVTDLYFVLTHRSIVMINEAPGVNSHLNFLFDSASRVIYWSCFRFWKCDTKLNKDYEVNNLTSE